MPDINLILRTPRHDGFECDKHLGPFLTSLKRWHDAVERYQVEHPDDELPPLPDGDEFDDTRISMWRYMFGFNL